MLSLVVGVGSAHAAALNYTDDTNVAINGRAYYIAAGSVATQIVLDTTTLAVTVPAGGPFTLKSANGDTLTNTASVLTGCIDTTSIVTLTAAATVTFTPTSVVACGTPAPSGGGSQGGGGGGGGSSDATAPVAVSLSINAGAATTSSLSATLALAATDNALVTQMIVSNDAGFAGATWESYALSKTWTLVSGDGVKTVYAKFRDAAGNMSAAISDTITVAGSGTVAVVVTTPAPTQGCSGSNMYNTSTGALCVNNAGAEIPGCGNRTTGFSTASGQSCLDNRATGGVTLNITNVPSTFNFGTVTLKNGSKGAAVMELQRFLNKFLNLGLVVDGKLGPKTIAVIKAWQKGKGLVADGLVGAKTKAKMNAEAQSN